ncbi:hypothetical protein Tco_0618050 [Tanacetum coccineum]
MRSCMSASEKEQNKYAIAVVVTTTAVADAQAAVAVAVERTILKEVNAKRFSFGDSGSTKGRKGPTAL